MLKRRDVDESWRIRKTVTNPGILKTRRGSLLQIESPDALERPIVRLHEAEMAGRRLELALGFHTPRSDL